MAGSVAETTFRWSHPSQIPFAREDPDAPAVADVDRSLTSGEFAAEVERVAGGLAGLGIGRGDVVATMLPNRVELVVVMFAAWRLGAVLTPVNPALTGDEAGYQLADAGAKLVVVSEATERCVQGSEAQVLRVDELGSLEGEAPAHDPAADDTALLIYTSGTTGRPKGVILDHANVAAMVGMVVAHLQVGPEDRALVALPLFHVNGLVVSILTPLSVGGSTVILEKFSKATFWDSVAEHRPTYFSLVPAMYLMFNAMEETPDASMLRFCVCGAAPVPAEALKAFHEKFGTPIIEGYGLSETTVATNIDPLDGPRKPGSVGPGLPGTEVRVVDENDEPVPTGERGQVVMRGPQIMRGYLNRPEETEETLRGGWLHSGDVGYLDEDGYLFLVDRTKDMIIRGGENIYPTEIENALVSHDAVLEAAVVGRPDDMLGEVPVAFVAFNEGAEADVDELLAFAKERLAKYKVPTEVRIVDALPRNPVGKLDKPTMREEVEAS
jgi:long-chain acyl-CoA synthetase